MTAQLPQLRVLVVLPLYGGSLPIGRYCATALAGLGYRPAPGSEKKARLTTSRALYAECYDIGFVHPDHAAAVELHWRMNHRHWPEPLPGPGGAVRQQTQAGALWVPSDAADMLYLPLHGTAHLWARLKWLADLVPLTRRRGPDGLAADLAAAEAAGCRVPVALGLRLAARLFGTALPASLSRPDPGLARREAWLMAAMARPDMAPGTPRYRFWVRAATPWLIPGLGPTLGVMRYDTLRRLRLGVAPGSKIEG